MAFASQFDYDPNFSPDIRVVQSQEEDGVSIQNLTFRTPFGYRRAAYLVSPLKAQSCAAVLFAHWLETWDPTANRRQFLAEAKTLSAKGAVCLLVETMWSDQDWFIKRSHQDDVENSIRQVVELRIATDLLLAQQAVDPTRFGYVGHDFGGMYGVLTGSIDRRASCYVIMAIHPTLLRLVFILPPNSRTRPRRLPFPNRTV